MRGPALPFLLLAMACDHERVGRFQQGNLPSPTYAGAADALIVSTQPTANAGTASTALVIGGSAAGSAALLRWDLAGVAPDVTVDEVTVTLTVLSDTSAQGQTFQLYEVKQPWVDGAATWERFGAHCTWELPGARGATDRGDELLGTFTPSAGGATTTELTAAGEAAVQRWVVDPASNHGVIITSDGPGGFTFATADGPAASAPLLAVELYPPAPDY